MIPRIYIQEHAEVVPWQEPRQIEQDLIIVKALLSIYSDPFLSQELAFRGGTALNKLFFNTSSRYSEDIDLVQINSGKVGPIMSKLREVMAWLNEKRPDWSSSPICNTLTYKTKSDEGFPIRLKLEINTREHFTVLGWHEVELKSTSDFCKGTVLIRTYKHEELLGTKLRALYHLKTSSKEFRVIILVEQKETIQEPKKEKKKRLKALQVKTRDLVFDREEAHER